MAGTDDTSTNSYDAIVIGGGHNGLVTAAYLGKAGLKTVVLERRETVGGAIGTTELAPGARVPTLAHTVGRLRPSVVRDLDLKRHGLSLVGPDVRAFAPGPDGDAIVLWGDAAKTAEGLRTRSSADAERYASFDRLVRSLSGFLGDIAGQTPPDIELPGLGDALSGLRLGRTFRGLGKHDGRTITRVLPMAVADFVAESFESDALQAAIAWRGVAYTAMGPWSAGTTAVLLMDAAGNDGGAAGQTVYVRGGPGALASALAAAATAAGVEIRTGADVEHITSRDGRATGVVLGGGEELTARAVVAGIDPKRALTALADPVAVGPSLLWRADNIRTPGTVAKVNLVLSALPRFTAAGDDARLLRGRILIATGIDAMERAHDAAKFGRLPDEPMLEATIPSLADPSLIDGAAPGTHVMSVIVQPTPHTLREHNVGRPARGARRPRGQDSGPVRAGSRRVGDRASGHHPGRPRARLRLHRRPPDARRARPRPVLPVAAAAGPRPLPARAGRAVPGGRRIAPGRRRDRPERPERGA